MSDNNAFLVRARNELRTKRSLSDATCSAFEVLPESVQAAYARAIAFAGCSDARVPIGREDIKVPADERAQAAELMLLKLSIDTGDPVWSSYVMERMEAEVVRTPGGRIEDLFRALAAVFNKYNVPLTDTVSNFVKDLVVLAFTRYRNSYESSDFTWLVEDLLLQPTPALAYLGLLALPDGYIPAAREAILAALADSPFADEAATSLTDDESK